MHVIITGGSSGIGLAIAMLYAARGDRVSLLARDAVRLERARMELVSNCGLSVADTHVAPVDVASADGLIRAVAACERALGPCDVMIASAGIVEPGPFEAMSSVVFAEQITTNLIGTANAVRSVFGAMTSRKRGRIMIVSSGAALIGIHGYSAYCASKAALGGFVEALRAEAAGSRVTIGICFPPDTLTPQYEYELPLRSWEAALLMGKVRPWRASDVAAAIVRSLDRGRPQTYFSFSIAALAYFGPLIKPVLSWWYLRQLRKIASHPSQELPGLDPGRA